MIIGYARTSTVEQVAWFEAQERDLVQAGCERIFKEQVSSVAKREQLATAINFARDGDVLVVTKLDRLARSMAHLVEIIATLKSKGVALRVLALGLDTASPTGGLILNVLGAVAQFEREMMLERQREGIAKAKAEGKYKGRKPTAQVQADQVRQMHADGVRPTDIARRLGMGRTSVYRCLGNTADAPERAT
jgi:DNA invertase Pin-like site-specific DNA recombinase